MFKKLFAFGLLFVLVGCKTRDPANMIPSEHPIQPKLVTLETSITDCTNSTVIANDIESEIFSSEVEKNLIDPYEKKYGYMTLSTTPLKYTLNRSFQDITLGNLALQVFSCWFVMVPNLFGMPFSVYKLELETTVKILDSNRKVIGKYDAIGKSKNSVAFYYGYTLNVAKRKTQVEALKKALQKIRPKIASDVERLNNALNKAGPIKK